jgi:hypothetical protein
MIKLVTGSTGTTHITAADDGALHAAIAGAGLVVFEVGANLAATVINSTLIRIDDGEGLVDGRHFRIRPGEFQELALSDGVAGYNRNDLIALHYTNNGGVESLSLEVLEGDYSEGAAVDPVYSNNAAGILGGAMEHYAPLYRLKREGINPPTVEALFVLTPSMAGGAKMLANDYTAEPVTTESGVNVDVVIFTATEPGLYAVSYSCSWKGSGTGLRRILLRDPDGFNRADARAYPGGTGDVSQHLSCFMYLEAGAGVTMRAFQNSGAALNILNQTWQVVKIGA